MKLVFAALMTLSALPVSAESIGDRSNRQAYASQRGWAKRKSVIEMNIVKSMFLARAVLLDM